MDADPLGDPNDMVATIDWGDGTPVTAGTVVQDAQLPPGGGTSFHVEGSHTYTEESATPYTVTVTITDRGPYVRGRSLDLSLGAARELEMLHRGVTRVLIDLL